MVQVLSFYGPIMKQYFSNYKTFSYTIISNYKVFIESFGLNAEISAFFSRCGLLQMFLGSSHDQLPGRVAERSVRGWNMQDGQRVQLKSSPIPLARVLKRMGTRGLRLKRKPPGDTTSGRAENIPCSCCTPWRLFPE
jgi:hypothetical protein